MDGVGHVLCLNQDETFRDNNRMTMVTGGGGDVGFSCLWIKTSEKGGGFDEEEVRRCLGEYNI